MSDPSVPAQSEYEKAKARRAETASNTKDALGPSTSVPQSTGGKGPHESTSSAISASSTPRQPEGARSVFIATGTEPNVKLEQAADAAAEAQGQRKESSGGIQQEGQPASSVKFRGAGFSPAMRDPSHTSDSSWSKPATEAFNMSPTEVSQEEEQEEYKADLRTIELPGVPRMPDQPTEELLEALSKVDELQARLKLSEEEVASEIAARAGDAQKLWEQSKSEYDIMRMEETQKKNELKAWYEEKLAALKETKKEKDGEGEEEDREKWQESLQTRLNEENEVKQQQIEQELREHYQQQFADQQKMREQHEQWRQQTQQGNWLEGGGAWDRAGGLPPQGAFSPVVHVHPVVHVNMPKTEVVAPSSSGRRKLKDLPSLKQLSYSVGGTNNTSNLAEWRPLFDTFLVSTDGRIGTTFGATLWAEVDAAHDDFVDAASGREQIQVTEPGWSKEFWEMHGDIVSHVISKLPESAQTYARQRAEQRADGRGLMIFDALYYVRRIMDPSSSTERTDTVKALKDLKTVKLTKIASDLAQYNTLLMRLEHTDMINRGDDYVDFYRAIDHRIKDVGTEFKFKMMLWKELHPMPTKRTSRAYFYEFFNKVQSCVSEFYPAGQKEDEKTAQNTEKGAKTCTWCTKNGFNAKNHNENECHKKAKEVKKLKEEAEKNKGGEPGGGAPPKATPKGVPKGKGKGTKGKGTEQKSKRACRALVNKLECKFGAEKCYFSHGDKDVETAQQTECPYGKHCKFRVLATGCFCGQHNTDGTPPKEKTVQNTVCFEDEQPRADEDNFVLDCACDFPVVKDMKKVESFVGKDTPMRTTSGRVSVPEVIIDGPTGSEEAALVTQACNNLQPLFSLERKKYSLTVCPPGAPLPPPLEGTFIHSRNEDGTTRSTELQRDGWKILLPEKLPETYPIGDEDKEKAKEAMHTVRGVNGKDWPCHNCDGEDHWASQCPVDASKGNSNTSIEGTTPIGLLPASHLTERATRIIRKALTKVMIVALPILYFWSSNGMFGSEPPLFESPSSVRPKTVWDMEMDGSFNILMLADVSGSQHLPPAFSHSRVLRVWLVEPGNPINEDPPAQVGSHFVSEGNRVRFAFLTKKDISDEDAVKVLQPFLQGFEIDPNIAKSKAPIPWPEPTIQDPKLDVEAILRYVDDLMVESREERMKEIWGEIDSKMLRKEEEKGEVRFLGRKSNGKWLDKYTYLFRRDQTEFAETVTREFFTKYPEVRRKKQTHVPGKPVPIVYGSRDREKTDEEYAAETKPEGKFAKDARHFVMSTLYLEAGSRPDLSYEQNKLQCALDCWTTDNDTELIEFMEYIEETYNYVLLGIIDTRDFEFIGVSPLTDASFADRKNRKSTLHFFTAMVGPRTFVQLEWKTKGMSSWAVATLESEGGGIMMGLRNAVRHALQIGMQTGKQKVPIFGVTDNLGAQRNLTKGAGLAKTMRCARRVLGYSAGAISDVYADPVNSLGWASGSNAFVPDKGTKSLPLEKLEPIRLKQGLVEEGVYESLNTTKVKKESKYKEKHLKAVVRKAGVEEKQAELMEHFKCLNLTSAELKKLVHQVCNHRPYDASCEVCVEQKGTRHSHGMATNQRNWEGWVFTDTAGRVIPKGHLGVQYVHRMIYILPSGLPYRRSVAVRSKHSAVSKEAFNDFHSEIVNGSKSKLKVIGVKRDGGKEYLGAYAENLVARQIASELSSRFTPKENGKIENSVNEMTDDIASALKQSGTRDTGLWPEACRYADDTANILTGAHRELFGDSTVTPDMMCPAFSKCFINKEVPEHDEKFHGKNFEGFVYGFDGKYHLCGYYLNGKLKHCRTNNAKIMKPFRSYFEGDSRKSHSKFACPSKIPVANLAIAEERKDAKEQEQLVFVCCECDRCRIIDENEKDAVLELIEFTLDAVCEDVGRKCSEASDALGDDSYEIPRRLCSAMSVRDEKNCMMTKKIMSGQAWSLEPFGDTGKTWADCARDALAKEMGKWEKFKAYDPSFCEFVDAVREYPNALFGYLGVTWVVKHWECIWILRRVAARLVFYGNRQHDASGDFNDGILEQEVMVVAPPSLAAVSNFEACAALKGHPRETADLDGAYLQSIVNPNVTVFVTLAKEMMSPAEKLLRRACRRLWKSAYGQRRGGFDYDDWADESVASLGFTSGKLWDSEPCVYVRQCDGSRSVAPNPDVPLVEEEPFGPLDIFKTANMIFKDELCESPRSIYISLFCGCIQLEGVVSSKHSAKYCNKASVFLMLYFCLCACVCVCVFWLGFEYSAYLVCGDRRSGSSCRVSVEVNCTDQTGKCPYGGKTCGSHFSKEKKGRSKRSGGDDADDNDDEEMDDLANEVGKMKVNQRCTRMNTKAHGGQMKRCKNDASEFWGMNPICGTHGKQMKRADDNEIAAFEFCAI